MDDVYECGFCEKEFSRVEELSAHADVCDPVLEEEENLVYPDDQGPSNQYNITKCKTLIKETNDDEPSVVRKTSKEAENGDSHVCNRCGKTGFSNKQTRHDHERRCNGLFVRQPKFKAWKSNGVYYCKEPKCTDKTPFQSEYSLRIHFYDNHLSEEEKIYECEYCDKRFALRTMRNKHVKATHEKSHSCDYCGRKFGAKAKLQHHVSTHTGEKPYRCDKCDYGTAKKCNLVQHKQNKHQEFPNKSHCCELCGKGFVTLGRVVRHMKVIHSVTSSKEEGSDTSVREIDFTKNVQW